MDFTLDLPIYESVLDEFMDRAKFKQDCYELRQLEEMCTVSDELQEYFDEYYLSEALQDNSHNFKKTMSSSLSRTKKTTSGLFRAYDKYTTAKGDSMYNSFQLFNKLLNLIIRVLSFIWKCLAVIPSAINKLLDMISRIPGDILTKIRGDIQLYITVDDINLLYKVSFIRKLKSFLGDAKNFTRGEYWKKGFFKGDEALARKLLAQYAELREIKFTKSTILMKDENSVKTYVSGAKVVQYSDIKGKTYTGSYLEALGQLTTDLSTERADLQEIEKNLKDKDWKSINSSSYSELSIEARSMINDGMNSVSGVISLIGNLLKYVTADIDTINKTATKILNATKTK